MNAKVGKVETDFANANNRATALQRDLDACAKRTTGLTGDVEKRNKRIAELEAKLAAAKAKPAPKPAPAPKSTLEVITKDKAPSKSERDDLQLINGIGPQMEEMLHGEGIYFFRQLAALDKAGVNELNELLPGFPGRIERDEWVPQARGYASGKAPAAKPQSAAKPKPKKSTLEVITKDKAPSKSERDDLQLINGIGPQMEEMLHGEGIYFFRQLAALDKAGVNELNELLPGFPGRIERDEWVPQARGYASGKAPAAAPAVRKGGLTKITKDKAPSKSERDDLKEISGVGPQMEKLLNEEGIYFFRQVASLDKAGVQELNDLLPDFPGRIERDEWVKQAGQLQKAKYGS